MSYTGILMIKTKISFLQQSLSIIIPLIALVTHNPARAEIDLTGVYTGLHFSSVDYMLKPDNGTDISESWGHMKAKLGTSLNDWFSVEGQFGLTTNSTAVHGVFTLGGYLRVGKDLGQYKPYGLIGVSGFHLYEDGMEDQTEAGASYGVGIEIFGTKDLTVTFEYLRLMDISVDGGDLTFDTIGFGFTCYFTEDKSYFNKNRNKIRSIRY